MSERRHNLVRKNRCIRERHEWLRAFAERGGLSEDECAWLSLEESDVLTSQLTALLTNNDDRLRRLNPATDRIPSLFQDFKKLGSLMQGETLTLIPMESSIVGVLRVPAPVILHTAEKLYDFLDQYLSLATVNLKDGLVLERDFYDLTGAYVRDGVYGLTLWGRFATLAG